MTYTGEYLVETMKTLDRLDTEQIDRCVDLLAAFRDGRGRLFVLGVGGSAANASHAVSDFRKLCGIEAYAPTDNVAEFTARTNDDGWESTFKRWLETSRLSVWDALLVLSVGGGTDQASQNLKPALMYARAINALIIGIVGRESGATSKYADECIVIPEAHPDRVTPHAEECQAILWHLMANHPSLRRP